MELEIQRLNMDNSWLVNFAGQKILIDPWLQGAEIDFFSWFNKQTHRTKPISFDQIGTFDFILITQKYPDHFHPETLLKLKAKKLIVPKSIKEKVQKLLPDSEVITFNNSPSQVFETAININFLSSPRKLDPIYDALLLDDGRTSIFIATHGYLNILDFKELLQSKPKVKLAFSPFNKYELPLFLGGTIAPGIDGVLKLVASMKPEYIVATHDEDKIAEGIVSKFAKVTWAPNTKKIKEIPQLKNSYLAIDDYRKYKL